MKRFHYCVGLTVAASLLAVAQEAKAVLLSYDGFAAGDYTAGNLDGQAYAGTGYAAGGAWNTTSQFVVGGLSYPNLMTTEGFHVLRNNGDATGNLDLSAGGPFDSAGLVTNGAVGGTGNTGTIYYSFLARQETSGSFAGFNIYNGGTENLGIGKESSRTTFSHFQPNGDIGSPATPLDNETHLFVVRIDYGMAGSDDVATIWLDPDTTLSEAMQDPTISSTTGTDDQAFNQFRLRGNHNWSFDEVRFGTTFDSVTPIPEPSSAVLGLLATVAFGACMRRRRI
ncbi:hypothetical protein BH23VER1_BH23VER1_13200 [soil metagenome]